MIENNRANTAIHNSFVAKTFAAFCAIKREYSVVNRQNYWDRNQVKIAINSKFMTLIIAFLQTKIII